MGKIRIMHLRNPSGWYGAEEVIANLAGGLYPKGYDAVIVSLEGSQIQKSLFLRTLEERGVRGMRVSCHWIFALFQLTRLVKKHRIDIIHTHTYKSDFLGFLTAKLTGKKLVATAHGWTETEPKLRLMGMGNRLLLRYFDKVICPSKAMASTLKNVDPSNIEVIPNGINFERLFHKEPLNEFWKNLFFPFSDSTIAVIGRLSPEKGHRYLFKAMAEITKHKPELRLMVVGDGPLRKPLSDLAESMGISRNVIFTGYRKDIGNLLSSIDLLVMPSLCEGFCLAVLEAIAYGKPVVASEVRGIIDIAKECDQVHLVPPKDPKEMASAILKILSTQKGRRERSDSNLLRIAEKFSSKRMIEAYERVYLERLNEGPCA